MFTGTRPMRASLALALALAFAVNASTGSMPDLSTIPGCSRDVEDSVEEVSLLQTQSGTTLRTATRTRASSRMQATATTKARTVAAQPEPTHVELNHAALGPSARRFRDQQQRADSQSRPMNLLSAAIGPYESEDEAGRHRIQQHVNDLKPMGFHGFFLAGAVISLTVAMLLVFWIFGAQPMNPDTATHKGTPSGQSSTSGASTPRIDVPEVMPQTKAQAQLAASANGDVDAVRKFDIATPQASARKFEEDMTLAAKLSKKLDEELVAKQKADDESVAKSLEEESAAKKNADEELVAKTLEEERAAKTKADEELAARMLEEERAAKQKAHAELVAKKLEEERAAKQKADEELAAQKLEEETAAKQKADEELAAKNFEEERAAKQKADEELAAKKLEEEISAKQKVDEELVAKKLEEERAAKQKADEEHAAQKLQEEMAAEEKAEDLEKESLANGAAPSVSSTVNEEEAAPTTKKANGRQRGTKKPRQGGASGKR